MDMSLVTLILVLVTIACDGMDMAAHLQDRVCLLCEKLAEEVGEGCDHGRMVIEVGVCGILAPPSWSCEGNGVEIDLGVHYHNSHACREYNYRKIIN